jgi:hypothetical protein
VFRAKFLTKYQVNARDGVATAAASVSYENFHCSSARSSSPSICKVFPYVIKFVSLLMLLASDDVDDDDEES